jgi:hypothetical protein
MSFVFAVGMDGAVMHFDEVAHYREAQARSAVLARPRPVSLAEALEDEWKEIALDPLPRVAADGPQG